MKDIIEIYGRVVSVRKHKNSVFIDIFSNKTKIEQCTLVDTENDIHIGDILHSTDFYEGVSKRGTPTVFLNSYQIVGKPQKIITKKGLITYAEKPTTQLQQEALLGGNSLQIALARIQIYQAAMKFLNEKGFVQVFSDNLDDCRGAYSAIPFEVYNKAIEKEQYLRITLELELKKQMCFFLKPVYELGKVYRNMGKNIDHAQEFSTLETVIPFASLQDIYSILYELVVALFNSTSSSSLSTVSDIVKKPVIISYDELMQDESISFKECKQNLQNHIVYNIPQQSPLAKWNDKSALEFVWVFNGCVLSHGYEDEYDIEILQKRFQYQIDKLQKEGIFAEMDKSFLDTIALGMPASSSFSLGLDRLIQKIFSLSNINTATNPLGV